MTAKNVLSIQSEIAREVAQIFQLELSPKQRALLTGRKACLMANHGLVCLERDLSRALALAIEVEHLARSYCACLAIGEPELLDSAEMACVIEKFRHYGYGK